MHEGLAAPTRMTATAFLVWLRDAVERLSSTREVCVQPASSRPATMADQIGAAISPTP